MKKRFLCFMLGVILAVSQVSVVSASSRKEELKQQKAETQSQLAAQESKIDNLEIKKQALTEEINKLDADLVNVIVEIEGLKNEIINKEAQIEVTKADLVVAEKNRDDQYAAMKKRIQYLYENLFEIASHLEGLPRNIGVHASGIVMSNINIDETIPLYKNARNIYTTAYSMNYLEPLGLLKMDFLGISNLTLINEIIENIRKNENLNITFSNIPLTDKKTLDIFKKAETDGIFQFESVGMRRFLTKLEPSSFDDVVASLALYRPGAMEFIDNYIRRKNKQELVEYLHPSLEPILKSTYGIIIYQEQILQIARTLAGYSLGEADILRRAISKKKETILLEEKPKFISKSMSIGYSKETAEQVYNLILKYRIRHKLQIFPFDQSYDCIICPLENYS